MHFRLEIAAVRVAGIARQAPPHFHRWYALRENRHAIPRSLAVPDRAVSNLAQRNGGKRVVGRFELLQAHDVRPFLRDPGNELTEATADAVDVVSGDLHALR